MATADFEKEDRDAAVDAAMKDLDTFSDPRSRREILEELYDDAFQSGMAQEYSHPR